jgi:hypothetical protein
MDRVHVLREYATAGADRRGVADPLGGDPSLTGARDELEDLSAAASTPEPRSARRVRE